MHVDIIKIWKCLCQKRKGRVRLSYTCLLAVVESSQHVLVDITSIRAANDVTECHWISSVLWRGASWRCRRAACHCWLEWLASNSGVSAGRAWRVVRGSLCDDWSHWWQTAVDKVILRRSPSWVRARIRRLSWLRWRKERWLWLLKRALAAHLTTVLRWIIWRSWRRHWVIRITLCRRWSSMLRLHGSQRLAVRTVELLRIHHTRSAIRTKRHVWVSGMNWHKRLCLR